MRYFVGLCLTVLALAFIPDADAKGGKGGGKSSGAPKTVSVRGYTRKDATHVQPQTVSVRGYTRKDGTHVQPHTRSAPRTSARTTARALSVYGGGGTREDDSVTDKAEAAPVVVNPTKVEEVEAPAAKRKRLSESKLKYAKQFIEDGKPDVAKQWLKDCILNYPDTAASAEARKLIEDLAKP